MRFCKGFEKTALVRSHSAQGKARSEEKRPGPQNVDRHIAGLVSGSLLSQVPGVLSVASIPTSAGRPRENMQFLRNAATTGVNPKYERPKSVAKGYLGRLVGATTANFRPHEKGRGGSIHVDPRLDMGIVAHEWGHAKDMKHSFLSPATRVKLRNVTPLAGIAGSVAAASSKDEKTRSYAPLLAASGFAPMLSQEAKATYHGTKEIARQHGWGKALKSLRSTVPAFASYAAVPAGLYWGAKHYTAKKDGHKKTAYTKPELKKMIAEHEKLLGIFARNNRKEELAEAKDQAKELKGYIRSYIKEGADLTAKGRNQIKEENFALPGHRYPIHDASHARNALARVAQHGTPEEQAKVKAAVRKKYPGIGE